MNTDTSTAPPTEVILGQIVAKANNYQAVPDGKGGRRIIKTEKLREYEAQFAKQCRLYAGRKIDTPFELIVAIYYKSQVYDLDNSLKTLLDCLQYSEAITDDSLCTRIVADKLIDRYRPRVEFSIVAEPTLPSLFDDMG